MDKAVRVRLPEELAQELVEADLAVRAFTTRGGPEEIIGLAIDGFITAANVVTVLTAPEVVQQVAKRLRRFLNRRTTISTVITVEGPRGVRAFDVDGASEEEVAKELAAALSEVSAEKPG